MKKQNQLITFLLILAAWCGAGNAPGQTVGTVVAWGYNGEGQTTVPAGLSGVTAIAAGGYEDDDSDVLGHTVALKNDGSVVAWGHNGYGQVTGTPSQPPLFPSATASPVTLGGQVLSGVTAIAAGGLHTVALKNDGSVVAWGAGTNSTGNWPNYGQSLVPVAAQSGVTAIAAGGLHTVALKNDGSVVAWGGTGPVPVAAQSGVTAIAAGLSHTVALKNDGTVVAWGHNGYGQVTGTPTTDYPFSAIASPVTLGGQVLTGVTAIAAGGTHTVALKNDGSVVVWGRNWAGQTNVPFAAQSGVTAIAAFYHIVALKNDGSVVAWGYNGEGQTTVPAGLCGVTAIAAGYGHTVALLGQSSANFDNLSPIVILDDSPAAPFPSSLVVSGVTGTVQSVGVTLYGFSHTYPADVEIWLVGPGGQMASLMINAGGGFDVANLTLTFSDDAGLTLPLSNALASACYRPDALGPPLAVFNGTEPNGTWSLFVEDVDEEDSGIISGGWRLTLNGQCCAGSTSDGCDPLATWFPRASGTNLALNDMAYGNGQFVAVGVNATVATSSNGVTWRSQSIPGIPTLNSIAFGIGRFVAVGAQGVVAYSTNGSNWSITAFSLPQHGVAFGANLFVSVGTNGTIFTSTNAAAWFSRSSGTTNVLNSVAFGNGRFVAVGRNGTVLVSTNGGVNWTTSAAGTLAQITDVTFGSGLFVAVGAGGMVLRSPDGLVWTPADSRTAGDLSGVAFGRGFFVAVGNLANNNAVVLHSSDGQAWTTIDPGTSVLLNDVAFGGSSFIGVGQGGAIVQSLLEPIIVSQPQSLAVCVGDPLNLDAGFASGCPVSIQWRRDGMPLAGQSFSSLYLAGALPGDAGNYTVVISDGIVTLTNAPAVLQVNLCPVLDHWLVRPAPSSNALYGAACAAGTIVAVGNSGTLLRSADGSSWTAIIAPTNAALNAVTYGTGRFVAVGNSGVILSSPDAASWTLENSNTNRILRGVAYGAGLFVAVGDGTAIATSGDGVAWASANLGNARSLLGVAFEQGMFVVVGAGGSIFTSTNGSDWTARISGFSLTLYSAAYGAGAWVAVGNGGKILRSTNGVDWLASVSPTGSLLDGVAYAHGEFVAVGAGGVIISSSDGINWFTRQSPTAATLHDVVACGDVFLAVGENGVILQTGFHGPPRLTGRMRADGFEVGLTGQIGTPYRLQATTNFAPASWLDVMNFTNVLPHTLLLDHGTTDAPQRYYRIVTP